MNAEIRDKQKELRSLEEERDTLLRLVEVQRETLLDEALDRFIVRYRVHGNLTTSVENRLMRQLDMSKEALYDAFEERARAG